MEAIARDDITLARVRAEFDQSRSGRSGRGRIPDRLWRLAVSLLDSFSVAVICREPHLSAGDLRKHRQALDTKALRSPSPTPAFVELRAVSRDARPCSPRPVIIGRTNALEIVLVDGRPVARRYSVYFRVEHGAKVIDAEFSDEPLEVLTLPLTREAATAWLWQHFEDFAPDRISALVARLVCPTGPLV